MMNDEAMESKLRSGFDSVSCAFSFFFPFFCEDFIYYFLLILGG